MKDSSFRYLGDKSNKRKKHERRKRKREGTGKDRKALIKRPRALGN